MTNSTPLTYGMLSKISIVLLDAFKDRHVTVYIPSRDEYYQVKLSFEETDVLDKGHPFLTVIEE